MPLFKNRHDGPVDAANPNYQARATNDGPNSAGAGYPSEQGAYMGGPQTNTTAGAPLDNSYGAQTAAHPSGVGAPVDSSYGNQTSTYHHGHPGAAAAGGAAAGHELGGHAGPGAAVGGIAGNRASHQHNQPTTGYSGDGYNDGYAGQPGVTNANVGHPGAMGAGTGGTTNANAGQPGMMGTNATGQNMNAGGMSTGEARMLEMKGKAQQLAGVVLSSQSLKAKGAANEQQGAAIRHQGANLGQAERHEAAALRAREQAVAHGAHQDHGRLGGAGSTL